MIALDQYPVGHGRSISNAGDARHSDRPSCTWWQRSRRHQFTPEVFAAFEAGDEYTLRRSLKLPPWHASPLDTDLEGPPPYGGEGLMRIKPGRPPWISGKRYSRC